MLHAQDKVARYQEYPPYHKYNKETPRESYLVPRTMCPSHLHETDMISASINSQSACAGGRNNPLASCCYCACAQTLNRQSLVVTDHLNKKVTNSLGIMASSQKGMSSLGRLNISQANGLERGVYHQSSTIYVCKQHWVHKFLYIMGTQSYILESNKSTINSNCV